MIGVHDVTLRPTVSSAFRFTYLIWDRDLKQGQPIGGHSVK
jgi:hypothetical protein